MSKKQKPLSREEVAAIEVGSTGVSPGLAKSMVVLFLLFIALIPWLQQVVEVRGYLKGDRDAMELSALSLLDDAPAAVADKDRLFAKNKALLGAIDQYEDDLEDESFLTKKLLGPVQLAMTKYLGVGNEQAYVGKDGWLYYRPGFDHVTGAPFLDEKRLENIAKFSDRQPDPVQAILDFKAQLAERGIELIVMPAAVKPSKHIGPLGADVQEPSGHPVEMVLESLLGERLENPSTVVWFDKLEEAGITVVPTLGPFLKTDTHWHAASMRAQAAILAEVVGETTGARSRGSEDLYKQSEQAVTNHGDIAVMLQLPEDQTLFPPETVTIHPVETIGGQPWKSREDAEVLLLGDSFANIYSLEGMGWGANAGLAEQLSYDLQKPVDKLCINDNGAFASRELLQQELRNGNDRLAGKKVVIWEFASRELSVGDWKLLDMTYVPKEDTFEDEDFYVPEFGTNIVVTAKVEDASQVQKPGEVPYKDHIRMYHLTDLRNEAGEPVAAQAGVYIWSMKDNLLVDGAQVKKGDEVRIKLQPWRDVEDQFGSFNRSELDGDAFLLADFCWGELVKPPQLAKAIPIGFYVYLVGLLFLGCIAVQRAKTFSGEGETMNWKKVIGYTVGLSVITLPWFVVGTAAEEEAQPVPTATTTTEPTASEPVVDPGVLQQFVDLHKTLGDQKVYEGKEGWLFLPSEIRHLAMGEFWGDKAAGVSKARNPAYADPLPTIIDLHKQLSELGVELVFMPVPTKASIYADKLVDVAPGTRIDAHHQNFYAALKDAGVKVQDLTPAFLAARSGDENVYCQQDTHWATKGIEIAAEAVAADIKAQDWYKALTPASYDAKESSIVLSGDLREMAGGTGDKAEEKLLTISAGGKPVEKSKDSPVLILGDSHTLVFGDGGDMHAVAAGFPDILAHKLGIPVDLIGIRGSGVGAARRNLAKEFIRNPDYAGAKKVVVWLFAGRDLTETSDGIDWRPLPMKK